MLDSFKENIGTILLKRKAKSLIRNKKVHNLDTAKKIGIIFNASKQDNFLQIKEFTDFLLSIGIKVKAIGFVDKKEALSYFQPSTIFEYFNKKNLNWYGKPKNPIVDSFLNEKYDVLIDFSLNTFFPIKYIDALCNAEFKVGKFVENDNYYDFMININEKRELKFFINQVKHYLTIINQQK